MILDLDLANKQAEVSVVPEVEIIENLNYSEATPIQQFYKNSTIFITGGTGFLGKVLIRKLLRCCTNISKIYLLMRIKKGKNIDERIEELFNDPLFTGIRNIPNFEKKIVGIPGDCNIQGLGICPSDMRLLIDDVSIVFHVAATVRFNEKLKDATAINLQSTATILDMCKNMQNLKSFIHVSTAYSNCFSSTVDEKFYDYPIKSDKILQLGENGDYSSIINTQIIESWPNTYTFTKAMAEDLLRSKNKNLPMGIFRPGIVISAAHKPSPGWVDNLNGANGIAAGIASGIIRTMQCDSYVNSNVVPVDLTVNALIASAWEVAEQTERRDEDMLIYNYTSTPEAPLSWGSFRQNICKYINEYPSSNALWYKVMEITKYKFLSTLYAVFLHWIPALLIDSALICTGQKPKMQKVYQKVHKHIGAISNFSTQEWDFKNENVQKLWSRLDSRDQELFPFTMKNFDWQTYFADYIKGIRVHLLKDDMKTLEVSRIKWKRLYWAHQFLKFSGACFSTWCIWSISTLVF